MILEGSFGRSGDVVMNVAHMVREAVQVHKDQDITKTRRSRNFMP